MKSVRVFADSEEMAEEIARRWYRGAEMAIKTRGVFSVTLSGGATPPKVYQKMASPLWINKIPWDAVHIFWTDERCVPPESKESNYQTICRALLNHLPIPKENVHRMKGEEEPEKESIRYAKEIKDHMVLRNGQKNLFDWVLLGLGIDGHTASLFPGQEKVLKTSNLCEVTKHPETDQTRITLTPSAIQSSTCITYHVIGKQKAEIVSELVLNPGKNKKYPADNISGEWYLDKAAALGLKSSPITNPPK
jgi:6-phosphogluconolactonase